MFLHNDFEQALNYNESEWQTAAQTVDISDGENCKKLISNWSPHLFTFVFTGHQMTKLPKANEFVCFFNFYENVFFLLFKVENLTKCQF